MQPEAPKLLEDIRAAGAFILDKTAGKTLGRRDPNERAGQVENLTSALKQPCVGGSRC